MMNLITAADILRKKYGINTRILHMASVKPIDKDAILKAASETGRIVTIEEHTVIGGLGGAVAEIVTATVHTKVKRIGIKDHFCDIGTPRYLLEKEGITAKAIVESILDILK